MICEDCFKFQDRTNDCSNCDKYKKTEPYKLTNIITIDYDTKFEAFNKLLELIYYRDIFNYDLYYRFSSSGRGIHVKIIFDKEMSFDERITIRRVLGDDQSRIELDIIDYEGKRDTDVVFFRKGRKRTTEWQRAKIEDLLKDLSPLPDHRVYYSREKIRRISKWLRKR